MSRDYWSLERKANESFYHFGDNDHKAWPDIFQTYLPPFEILSNHFTVERVDGHSFSFGLGASGSGVPFHVHGPVLAEVLHGAKRWFLSAPDKQPRFDPNTSSLNWAKEYEERKSGQAEWEEDQNILECVCEPGDVLYIPSDWWHSTLNIGDAVFISTFI